MRIDEEKQRREDYLEDICDVTKQDGLGKCLSFFLINKSNKFYFPSYLN